MRELAIVAAVALAGVTTAWIRYGLPSIMDRYRPAPVPGGWDADELIDLSPFFAEPYNLAERVVEVDELGAWCPGEHEPAQAALFDATAELHPVRLDWAPSWAGAS